MLLVLVWVLLFLFHDLPFLVLLLLPPWLLLLLLFLPLCLRCQLRLASLLLLLSPLLFLTSFLWLLPFLFLYLLSCFFASFACSSWFFCGSSFSSAPPCSLLGSFSCSLLIPCTFSFAVWSAASSPFRPSVAPAPAVSFPRAPVASSSFPFGSAPLADTVVSGSLLTIVSCSAPSLSSLAAPTPSLVPPVVLLGPAAAAPPPSSSLLALAPGYPSAPPAPISFFVSSGAPGIPPSALTSQQVLALPLRRGAPPSASHGSVLDFAGVSGA